MVKSLHSRSPICHIAASEPVASVEANEIVSAREAAATRASIFSNLFIEIYDNHLYVLFKYYPILRIYTLEGDLVRTIHFDDQGYENRVPGNYEWDALKDKGGGKYPFTFLFNALEVNDKGIFIGLYDEEILIDHYDLEGRLLRHYTRRDPDEAILVDFAVRQQGNTLKFYVLSRRPDYISKMIVLIGSP